jgi:hypothetical protein
MTPGAGERHRLRQPRNWQASRGVSHAGLGSSACRRGLMADSHDKSPGTTFAEEDESPFVGLLQVEAA